MVIGQNVASGVDKKAASKHVQMHRPAVALGRDDRVLALVHKWITLFVGAREFELRASLPIVKAQNRVDQANAVGIIVNDLLCDA